MQFRLLGPLEATDGDRLTGPAVEIARRLGELAAADEILVTRTVVDLVAGSGLRFERAEATVDGPSGPIGVAALPSSRGR